MLPAHQTWTQSGGSSTFDESDDSFILNPSIEEGVQARSLHIEIMLSSWAQMGSHPGSF